MSIPAFTNLSLERTDNVFIITLQNPPENKFSLAFSQEVIKAFRTVEAILGPNAEGAVITKSDSKFWSTGIDMDELKTSPFALNDGFYPLLSTVLDFPFPTIALLTGHAFGSAYILALAHDYRVMNAHRGFVSFPALNIGFHSDSMGALQRVKLAPPVARKMLLETHRWTGREALTDGLVDAVAEPGDMHEAALGMGRKWAGKAKSGMYAIFRAELYGEAIEELRRVCYIHGRDTSRRPMGKL
ncbi:hypothetical protein ASPWEDRAFT_188391 [Aspergillus wentii DTO 134E9]|uniref:Enoyl-CoA hydratase n=1 Tax=Aspergillus wentii DTO 134E9 TaxID=1073089 RepID=A0A1L9R538_ASPWE|nr:uncharacterized protein ASPWEDRAFT_188391 [Aspergillus wentii DTO 134E9]KAI9927266.1 hypothetical protein MW887_003653 [Aspergillus wentii]OJJ29997.1 hypothetical protein ASPWEDRAFT_188391 [Aspergillus wentii DTO 134E9]